MHVIQRILTVLVVITGLSPHAQAADPLLYTTKAVRTLPGSGHSWGFAALEPTRPLLWVARRENGLTVFDVHKQQVLKTLADSAGANAVAFVPARNRAYVANMDGTLGIIDLKHFKVLKRLPVDKGNLNNLVYDPHSDRVIISSGRRGDHSSLFMLDPASDLIVSQRDIAARKLDAPIVLKDGTVIIPLRDENQVAMLRGTGLSQQRLLSFPGCSKPSALAADEAGGHLFIACRGEQPLLVIADLDSGVQQATLPVTRAVNAMAYDPKRQQLLVPSGVDANLTVIGKSGAGQFELQGCVGTQPWAHNMVFDAARSRVYLFAMDFTLPAPTADQAKADPLFHADSFRILTLEAR